ncbi:MAG: hypothetical protein L6R37_006705 [Teloschistes peruensis]|nr:MAG: hypothetical protein L6R37_006705 [Teloschistes peruensis]
MTGSWLKTKGPRVGLTAQRLPYNHLLEHRSSAQPPSPREDDRRTVRESSADIFGPPKRDSSEDASPTTTSRTSEPDTPPPAKKRKREAVIREQVDLISPAPAKKSKYSPDRPTIEPSNIKSSVFTSSAPSSSQHSTFGRTSVNSSQKSQKDGQKDDDYAIFETYNSSQSRAKQKYGSRRPPPNIHKEAPTGKPKLKKPRQDSEEAEKLVKPGNHGFKSVDVKAIDSRIRALEKDKQDNFKKPPVMSPSPRSKRASRRSDTNKSDEQASDRARASRKPPQVQSPEQKKTSPPKFIKPPGLSPQPETRRSSRSGRSNQSSQDASVPVFPNLQSLKELRGFAENVQVKLQAQLEPPTSSTTFSSALSLELDIEDGNSSSPLSSAPEVQDLDATEDEWLKNHPPSSPKKQCPICKEFVSRLFMEESFGTAPMSVREQVQFCKVHKIRSAEQAWKTRGYPTIDWHVFAKRLPGYEDKIVEILNGSRRSFYRNAFEDQVKSGVNRTLQQSIMSGSGLEGLNVGYYGTKGARILMDFTMSHFASRIRRLASSDKLVSTGGVAGFVQAVLAPELAVVVVKDDMKVDDERAREILRESSEVGNLLNEEEDEIIRDEQET